MKKSFNIINSIVLTVVLTFASSCDIADFGDTNVNPNATTTPITSALLTNSISGIFGGSAILSTTPGAYAQYFSSTQYTEATLYAFANFSWGGFYTGALYDLENIIANNTDPETADQVAVNGSNNNQIAVARILKAYYFSVITDQVGDIPYTEALKGEPTAKYDTQADVYNSLFQELKEAVAQFDDGQPAKGDVLMYGDIDGWKKFANSWRMILALRISEADAALGKSQFADALNAAGGIITSNADNVTIAFPGSGFNNPYYGMYDGRKDWAISETIGDIMSGLNDPRLPEYGQPAPSGEVISFPYGLPRDQAVAFLDANPNFARILADKNRTQTAPFTVLSAAQIYLARAEAAQLGWTSENAADMYKTGIELAWRQWGVFDQNAFTNYMADEDVSLAAGGPLEKIQLQRWIGFYPNGVQGWSEWRRTGVPDLEPTPYATNSSKQIPLRFAYPTEEVSENGVAYKEAIGRMGGKDDQDTPVWWDK